jgi:glyceraldehyde 3-phosphate dehydrogenase
MERDDLEVVAINDLTDNKTLAHLLAYDTAYGRYDADISYTDDALMIDGKTIVALSERNPELLPWGELGVDVVVEATGVFRTQEKAATHLTAGAKRVVISAPAKDDETQGFVRGVNDQSYAGQQIVDNASCTTNCTTPVMHVLHEAFGVEQAMLTTIHSYTADQRIQDGPHKDLRRARAAAQNIVPTTTGAAIATTKIIPDLAGQFEGIAVRVPTITGSLIDCCVVLKRSVTAEEVNQAFAQAAEGKLHGILGVTSDPLVSSDIIGSSYSALVDTDLTRVVGGTLVKVVAWYDNEWGYANRLTELVALVGASIDS